MEQNKHSDICSTMSTSLEDILKNKHLQNEKSLDKTKLKAIQSVLLQNLGTAGS